MKSTSKKDKLTYTLYRWKKNQVSIRVTPKGAVHISAPPGCSRAEIEKLLLKNQQTLQEALRRAEERQQRRRQSEPDEEQLQLWREAASRQLPAMAEAFGERMGVKPAAIRINAARTRYGSCNQRGVLHFSCRVMALPQDCVELVVVHELAHLRQMNHSAAFYQEIAAILPDWQERRRKLRALERQRLMGAENRE